MHGFRVGKAEEVWGQNHHASVLQGLRMSGKSKCVCGQKVTIDEMECDAAEITKENPDDDIGGGNSTGSHCGKANTKSRFGPEPPKTNRSTTERIAKLVKESTTLKANAKRCIKVKAWKWVYFSFK